MKKTYSIRVTEKLMTAIDDRAKLEGLNRGVF